MDNDVDLTEARIDDAGGVTNLGGARGVRLNLRAACRLTTKRQALRFYLFTGQAGQVVVQGVPLDFVELFG